MSLNPADPPFLFPTPPLLGGPDGITAGNTGNTGNTGGGSGAAVGPGTTQALSVENILLAEFNYASTTAYQAMEDRARMFDRYLLIVGGVFVTGVGAIKQLSDIGAVQFVQPVALVILLAGAVVGLGFFVTLIGLRQAWQQSAVCMDVIKEYYIRRLKEDSLKADVSPAFYWRLRTLPKGERIGSATATVCSIVATLASACWAAAALVVTQLVAFQNTATIVQFFGSPRLYIPACLVGLISVAAHLVYFRRSVARGRQLAVAAGFAVLAGEKLPKRPRWWRLLGRRTWMLKIEALAQQAEAM